MYPRMTLKTFLGGISSAATYFLWIYSGTNYGSVSNLRNEIQVSFSWWCGYLRVWNVQNMFNRNCSRAIPINAREARFHLHVNIDVVACRVELWRHTYRRLTPCMCCRNEHVVGIVDVTEDRQVAAMSASNLWNEKRFNFMTVVVISSVSCETLKICRRWPLPCKWKQCIVFIRWRPCLRLSCRTVKTNCLHLTGKKTYRVVMRVISSLAVSIIGAVLTTLRPYTLHVFVVINEHRGYCRSSSR